MCCPASGARLDRVAKVVAHSIDFHGHDLGKDMKKNISDVLQLLSDIEPSEEVLASSYITGESMPEAYCRLVTWDQRRDAQPP